MEQVRPVQSAAFGRPLPVHVGAALGDQPAGLARGAGQRRCGGGRRPRRGPRRARPAVTSRGRHLPQHLLEPLGGERVDRTAEQRARPPPPRPPPRRRRGPGPWPPGPAPAGPRGARAPPRGRRPARRSRSTGSSVNWARNWPDLAVVGGHPVLEQLVGAGAVGVEPDPGAGRLAQLRAVRCGDERPAEGVDRGARSTAGSGRRRPDVPPLVRAADLQLDALVLCSQR